MVNCLLLWGCLCQLKGQVEPDHNKVHPSLQTHYCALHINLLSVLLHLNYCKIYLPSKSVFLLMDPSQIMSLGWILIEVLTIIGVFIESHPFWWIFWCLLRSNPLIKSFTQWKTNTIFPFSQQAIASKHDGTKYLWELQISVKLHWIWQIDSKGFVGKGISKNVFVCVYEYNWSYKHSFLKRLS